MNERLQALLDFLQSSLTPEREEEIDSLHRRALCWKTVERLPLITSYPAVSGRFQPYAHAEALGDPAKMLFNELVSAWGTSICHRSVVGDDLPCTVRANFGCVLIASLFGARIEQVEDNPPWARSFETREEFVRALERDPVDFTQGWCPRVVERYGYYREALEGYPGLKRVVKLVLPDLQGPLDTVELLRGSELYADFRTDPKLVEEALKRVAAAQVGFARHLAPLLSDGPDGWSHQHGFAMPGRVLLRVDSAIMISPRMYMEQVAPYDEQVIRDLGGGGLHSCGDIGLHAEAYLGLKGVQCVDLGQPELNDLDGLYVAARERKVPLLRVSVPREELISGAVRERFPTGVSLLYAARSVEDAREVCSLYKEASHCMR